MGKHYQRSTGTTTHTHPFVNMITAKDIFIDREALAKQGDNALGSVRPSVCPSVRLSVCPFVCALLFEPFEL